MNRVVAHVVAFLLSAVSLAACSGGGLNVSLPQLNHKIATIAGRTKSATSPVSTSIVPASTQLFVLAGTTSYSTTPGGRSIGTEPGRLFGATEVLPVIAKSQGYVEVLLPGPPNGEIGWISDSKGTNEIDPWAVVVSLVHRTISVYHSGILVGSSPAGIGAPNTPTPVPPGGMTFIDGDVVAKGTIEAPVLRTLGLHVVGNEASVDDAAIGANQVAIHGWGDREHDPSVFGQAISHACIRVPALFVTTQVAPLPNGTLVFISS